MIALGNRHWVIVQLEMSKSNKMYLQYSTFCIVMTLEITPSKKHQLQQSSDILKAK